MSGRTRPKTISPQDRVKGFDPYTANLDDRMAMFEATRCIMCYEPPCKNACPTKIDIPEFIFRIKTGNFYGSAKVIRESNIFGGECGYVCPVERLCESKCVRSSLGDEPVAISLLQRYAFEKEVKKGLVRFPKSPSKKGCVAVIGAGPASLSAAYELARKGFGVTICDSKSKPGGLMAYGILPWKALWSIAESEIENVMGYGIEFMPRTPISDPKLLLKKYDAVFIGTGAAKSSPLGIPGEDLKGFYLAQDFLEGVAKGLKKEGKLPLLKGKRVAVIGGGDTAIDAACSSVRLGAERVYLIYRRSTEEMPAVPHGRAQAREEGVEFVLLTSPAEVLGEHGRVAALKCVKMELCEPDASGRRSVKPVEDSEVWIDVEVVIAAVGQKPDQGVLKGFGVKLEKGLISVDENYATSIKGVFAAGDVVNGGETVVEAVAAGKKAAESIARFLAKEVS